MSRHARAQGGKTGLMLAGGTVGATTTSTSPAANGTAAPKTDSAQPQATSSDQNAFGLGVLASLPKNR